MIPTRFAAPLALALLCLPLPAPADQAAEEAAADLLQGRMQNQRPEDLALLRSVKQKDIVVVAGSMDRIQDVLRATGVPFTVIGPHAVAKADLRADQILMVNCPGEVSRAAVKRIEQFVRAGGTLYTTDWALRGVIMKAFPGTIRHNGASTEDHVTPVELLRPDDPLLTGMMLKGDQQPQWWLEGGSHPIKILDPERVEVLAVSKQMKRRYGAAPVVVRFRWHDGQVIHVVSHFYRQLATQGAPVAAKKAVEEVDGLTAAQKQSFKAKPAAEAAFGDVASSYAFQQMTSNLVVEKQKRNEELDRLYDATPAASPAGSVRIGDRDVKAGERLRVISRSAGKVRVRDDRGNEAELAEDAVTAR